MEPGIARVTEAAYHEDRIAPEPSLSSTLARKMIDQSPLHAWTASARLNPNHEPAHSDAFDIGKACHRLALGHGADVEIVDADNWTTKAAREARDAARAEGKTPMLVAQFEAADRMRAAMTARASLFGIDLSQRDRNEIAAFAQIEGVWCRALIDHAPANPKSPLIDVKTTQDASPEACVRTVAGYGYDVQAAHYQAVWEAATGERRGFRFIFVEKAPPHEVSVVELHDDPDDPADWMLAARDKLAVARRVWRHCLDTGHWPGYPAQIAVLGAPTFHTSKWEGRAKTPIETLVASTRWQAPAAE